MAKRKSLKKSKKKAGATEFHVYEQSDGALVALPFDSVPEDEDDVTHVGDFEAVNEADAIAQARKSNKRLRKAPAANPDHDPDLSTAARDERERQVNEKLGIKKPTSSRRKKSTAKKSPRKPAKKSSRRK
jgi:hypothetical protein